MFYYRGDAARIVIAIVLSVLLMLMFGTSYAVLKTYEGFFGAGVIGSILIVIVSISKLQTFRNNSDKIPTKYDDITSCPTYWKSIDTGGDTKCFNNTFDLSVVVDDRYRETINLKEINDQNITKQCENLKGIPWTDIKNRCD